MIVTFGYDAVIALGLRRRASEHMWCGHDQIFKTKTETTCHKTKPKPDPSLNAPYSIWVRPTDVVLVATSQSGEAISKVSLVEMLKVSVSAWTCNQMNWSQT